MATTSSRRSILALSLSGAALVLFIGTFVFALAAIHNFASAGAWVDHTMSVRHGLAEVGRATLMAESSQRGYVLTKNAAYLAPYGKATSDALAQTAHVRDLTMDNVNQHARVIELDGLVRAKVAEMQEVLDARESGGLEAAIGMINTNRGFDTMSKIHAKLREMEEDEDTLLMQRRSLQDRSATTSIVALTATSVLFGIFLVSSVAWGRAVQQRRDAAESSAARLRAENAALIERERTAQFQEKFIAILGHDLRNPLSSIRLGVRALKTLPPDVHTTTLERLDGSATRMARMIDQILDLTRSRLGGGIPISRAPCDLGAIVSDVAEETAVAHGGEKGSVVVERTGNLEGRWDPDRIGQVVSNLVGNALSYQTPGTPVKVAVSGQGASVKITVHNEGPAISQDLRRVLFDPFRRGERDSKTAHTAGLGLGLYITHEIVAAHGGRIDVESSDSAGTTFIVELPRT